MTVVAPEHSPAIRWGILGAGRIAQRFAREIPAHTPSTVAAVGSRDAGRAAAFAEQYGIATGYGSYDDLLADDSLDAIYIATPHSLHHEHALACLTAGKPILVEKSFTLDADEARDVFDLAKTKGLFAMEAMWSRFLPQYAHMRQMIADKELGELTTITAVHLQSLDLRPGSRIIEPSLGGGALLDLGVYPLSLFHWLCGVPDEIDAQGVLADTGVDVREAVTCRYGTALAHAAVDAMAPGRSWAQIVGTKGRLDALDWFYTADSKLSFTPAGGQPRLVQGPVTGGFQYQAAEVARCLADGVQQSPKMTWQDTIEVMRMMDAVRAQIGVVYPGEK
jgi:predicted dehydrogenase